MHQPATSAFLLLTLAALPGARSQACWPQFRGAGGVGIAREDKTLPARLDVEKNLIWKCAVPYGHSSPCIWEGRIFLTGISGTELETLCIDRARGEVLWRAQAWYEFIERVHRTNSPASPTPTTDGEHVCVYFGSSGLIGYDLEGKELWSRVILIPQNLYGTASSPILAGGRLIFCNDNRRESYLEAVDPATGETLWRKEREGLQYNWSTPMHWKNAGVDEIVVNGQARMQAYRLADGAETWSLPGLTNEPCITPVAGDGLLFLTSYNMKTNTEVIGLPPWSRLVEELDKDGDGELTREETRPNKSILSRADADGEGDHPLWSFHRFLDEDRNGRITEAEWQKIVEWVDSFPQANAVMAVRPPSKEGEQPEIVWKHETGVPEVPSPLCHEHRVYVVKNGGLITCLDSRTGALIYRAKLGAGGPYYASLVAGDGKIYAASGRGVVTVLAAGDELKILSQTELGERIWATPALVDGRVYVRTSKHLYAFGGKSKR